MKRSAALFFLFFLVLGFSLLLMAQQGPTRQSSETVARPRKPETAAEPAAEPEKIPSKYGKKPELQPSTTFRSDVIVVSLSVSVLDDRGQFIPNIPRGNFRVLEDNVPQQIATFEMGEAPMTVCMVIEFNNLYQSYWSDTWYQTLSAAYGFLDSLKPEDYVAVVSYDLRPHILLDFTVDKRQAYDAMRQLTIPSYSEANLFDAIADTAERMSSIEGRKAIVLLSTGIDTFSKLNFDKTRKILQNAGVPIYAIGLMQYLRQLADAWGYLGPLERLDFIQADNQLRTFAKETGGQAYFPKFEGEMPGIFRSIAGALRSQYLITYHPTNQARDGKFRRIKVELVDPATNKPLRVVDERGRNIRYTILAKNGYTAPREVE